MPELKECPFCGGKGQVYKILKPNGTAWRAGCGARVDCCLLLDEFNSAEDAAKVWNRRVNDDKS